MTTRKEILIKMYSAFLNEINDDDIKSLFPKLDEMDASDIVLCWRAISIVSRLRSLAFQSAMDRDI